MNEGTDSAAALTFSHMRWYDSRTGRFISEDPIGIDSGDTNLYRYVENNPTNFTDPYGLSPWSGIARILGKRWTNDTAERAGKQLATELLETLGRHTPKSQKAQEIIRELKKMGWVEGPLGKDSAKKGIPLEQGGGLILREVDDAGTETGRFLQWHPGGGHHGGDPYWKFTSGESGTLRYIGGTVTAVDLVLIPGAERAVAGDYSGGARELVYEVSPLGWGAWIGSYFSWLYDWARDESNSGKPGSIKF